MKLFKKLLWKYRKWKIGRCIKRYDYTVGLCGLVNWEISEDEFMSFVTWRREIKKDQNFWAFPTDKQNFQNRMSYLDEYIKWRINND